MRAISSTLERRIRRPDNTGRMLIEIDKITNAKIVDTYEEWGQADSLTGIERRRDGSVRLAGTTTTLIDATGGTAGANHTDLDRISPYTMVLVAAGDIGSNSAINQVIANLHPDPGATGRLVDQWRCQIWLCWKVEPPLFNGQALHGPTIAGDRLMLVPISPVVSVVESGTVAHDVTFNFSPDDTVELEFLRPPIGGGSLYPYPVLLVQIWAVKNDGTYPGNVAWVPRNLTSVSSGNTTVYGESLSSPDDGTPPTEGVYQLQGAVNVPRIKLSYLTYVNDDVTFTTNPLTGPGAGSDQTLVRLVGRARVPGADLVGGTRVRFYIRNDADTDWVQYTDGQRVSELVGATLNVSKKWRVELDTDAAGKVTPEVNAMGWQYVTTTPMHDTAEVVSLEYLVDPLTCRARLPEIRVRGIRDGVQDFNAAIDELLAANDIADLSISLYCGHPDDARSAWMPIDIFPIIDDFDNEGHSHVLIAVSPLAFLRGGPTGERRLPRFNTATSTREELVYSAAAATNAPSEIWYDLINVQLGLSDFWIGARPEDKTLTYLDEAGVSQTLNLSTITDIKKRIADSDAHEEVDAISMLSGHATVSSQGVIKAVPMRGGGGSIRAIFTADEISWASVTPGFRHRKPVLFTEYNFWDKPDAPDEVRSFHQNAIDNLGGGRISGVERLPQSVSSWIQSKALAEAIGAREIAIFGTGLLQWSFESIYPWPELELGDRIAVEIDRFVAKDPNAARELRGALWAVARIVGVHDPWGRRFTMWIENWADIISSAKVVTRTKLDELARVRVYNTTNFTLASGNTADMTFDAEVEDIGGFHTGSSQFLTIPTGLGGPYSASFLVRYTGGTSGVRFEMVHNVTGVIAKATLTANSAADGVVTLTVPAISLASGETIRLQVVNAGSGTITLVGGTQSDTSLALLRVSPIRAVAGTPQALPPGRGRWGWRPR